MGPGVAGEDQQLAPGLRLAVPVHGHAGDGAERLLMRMTYHDSSGYLAESPWLFSVGREELVQLHSRKRSSYGK